MPAAVLTPREVSELSRTPRHVVEKAMEERVLPVRTSARKAANGNRMLSTHAVAYAALVFRLDLRLAAIHKKRLYRRLAALKPADFRKARVELAPAVEIDLGRLVGDVMDRAESYRAARDAFIQTDERILGGTPVIRGTRVTVYSVLGRIEHGETVRDILLDNPDLKREAVETAVTYARTHPLMGRPAGRPWAKAA